MLNIYAADLELQGVLIFATEQRPSLAEEGGPVISTGHFIHNYPLIYGFAERNAEAYAVIPSLHFLSYEELKKSAFVSKIAKAPLRYIFVEDQLKKLLEDREAVYVFPAFPLRITTKKFFMQAKGSGYAEFRGALKTVYPRLEHYIAIVPPSHFRTIVLANNVELPQVIYIRIGMKRMGLFKVSLERAEVLEQIDEVDWTNVPVNLHDAGLFGYEIMDVIKVLETRSKAPSKPLASMIGYIRARKLFLVRCRNEEFRIPLPLKLVKK